MSGRLSGRASTERRHVRFNDEKLVNIASPEDPRREPDLQKTPTKKLIKEAKGDTSARARAALKRSELLRNRYKRELQKGTIMYKFDAKTGDPQKRWFYVNADGTKLSWTKTTTNMFGIKTTKTLNLADALYLTYGRINEAKTRSGVRIAPWLCFSVVFCERGGKGLRDWKTKPIHLGCTSLNQLHAWFFGIQSLIPLYHQLKTRAHVIWERTMMKVEKMAMDRDVQPAGIWKSLFEDAIRDVHNYTKVFMLRKIVAMNLSRVARTERQEREQAAVDEKSPATIRLRSGLTGSMRARADGASKTQHKQAKVSGNPQSALPGLMLMENRYVEKKVQKK